MRNSPFSLATALAGLGAAVTPWFSVVAAQGTQSQDGAATAAADPPPLYADLGSLHRPIGTKVARAQAYFDQGLRLYFGFNQEEAARAFREAARLDPEAPMPHWGVAMALGPNVNFPMDTAAERVAYAEAMEARRLAPNGSSRDRAYIDALGTRYSATPGADRARRDSMYANAMRTVVRRFPNDREAPVLLAEALMLYHPWEWFARDGTPAGGMPEAIAALEGVIRVDRNHPGACHFYIHAVEMSRTPERALPCAERLPRLMPGAGHIVHMPAHIYMRMGRYAEAVRANEHAAHTDEKYIGEQHPTGLYPFYYAHNLHFLWAAAAMDGRSAMALSAARELVATTPVEFFRQVPPIEVLAATPMLALARFGRWDEVLREPPLPAELKVATAMWHHARGLAYANTGRVDSAEAELSALREAAAAVPADQLLMTTNNARAVAALAGTVLEAEIASARGRSDDAVRLLREAVPLEDALKYDEPPIWYWPVRHRLGRALLAASRPRDAEAAFRADLALNPENGWSLAGLADALRAQGRTAAATAVERRLKRAWARADVERS